MFASRTFIVLIVTISAVDCESVAATQPLAETSTTEEPKPDPKELLPHFTSCKGKDRWDDKLGELCAYSNYDGAALMVGKCANHGGTKMFCDSTDKTLKDPYMAVSYPEWHKRACDAKKAGEECDVQAGGSKTLDCVQAGEQCIPGICRTLEVHIKGSGDLNEMKDTMSRNIIPFCNPWEKPTPPPTPRQSTRRRTPPPTHRRRRTASRRRAAGIDGQHTRRRRRAQSQGDQESGMIIEGLKKQIDGLRNVVNDQNEKIRDLQGRVKILEGNQTIDKTRRRRRYSA